jgi:hypothetical protein
MRAIHSPVTWTTRHRSQVSRYVPGGRLGSSTSFWPSDPCVNYFPPESTQPLPRSEKCAGGGAEDSCEGQLATSRCNLPASFHPRRHPRHPQSGQRRRITGHCHFRCDRTSSPQCPCRRSHRSSSDTCSYAAGQWITPSECASIDQRNQRASLNSVLKEVSNHNG